MMRRVIKPMAVIVTTLALVSVIYANDGGDFQNTPVVEIIGEFPCNNSDAAEIECRSLQATIDFNEKRERPAPINVILTVRHKIGVPLDNRWIIFDVGGKGGGYGTQSGSIGGYTPGTRYGDDLIRWYNNLNYVTLDITWWCSPDNTACSDEQKQWVAGFGPDRAEGWYKDTMGLGYLGASRRTTSIYRWVVRNNGGKKVGAHAHSAGSGRLITSLTVDDGSRFLDTVVFDGGPVFTYIPWYCELDAGPLGPQVLDTYVLSDFASVGRKRIFDIASDLDNGEGDYHFCQEGIFEENSMLASSAFLMAAKRDVNVHITVILGGNDDSPASSHARLWFQGYDGTEHGGPNIPPLSATSLTIIQGYCEAELGEYYTQQGGFSFPCTNWDPTLFPTADTVMHDVTLADVPHSTSGKLEGATAMFHAMRLTMPPPGAP